MQNITIHIEYFALFRAAAQRTNETMSTHLVNLIDLFEFLKSKYQFPLNRESVLVAVNESYAAWESKIQDGDRIVFLPPMAGG